MVSPLPSELTSHWWQRPGRSPGRELYHWHMLFHDQPEVRDVVATAQRKLAGRPEVDVVPLPWLHMTTLLTGFVDEVPAAKIDAMAAEASRRLAQMAPIPVKLGFIYYDTEAVVLPVEPFGALDPVHDALIEAASAAGCDAHNDTEPWLPHMSIAYSNRTAPAAPVIAALGRSLGPVECAIKSASLVAQTQVGRTWQWRPVAEAHLRGSEPDQHSGGGSVQEGFRMQEG